MITKGVLKWKVSRRERQRQGLSTHSRTVRAVIASAIAAESQATSATAHPPAIPATMKPNQTSLDCERPFHGDMKGSAGQTALQTQHRIANMRDDSTCNDVNPKVEQANLAKVPLSIFFLLPSSASRPSYCSA